MRKMISDNTKNRLVTLCFGLALNIILVVVWIISFVASLFISSPFYGVSIVMIITNFVYLIYKLFKDVETFINCLEEDIEDYIEDEEEEENNYEIQKISN